MRSGGHDGEDRHVKVLTHCNQLIHWSLNWKSSFEKSGGFNSKMEAILPPQVWQLADLGKNQIQTTSQMGEYVHPFPWQIPHSAIDFLRVSNWLHEVVNARALLLHLAQHPNLFSLSLDRLRCYFDHPWHRHMSKRDVEEGMQIWSVDGPIYKEKEARKVEKFVL